MPGQCSLHYVRTIYFNQACSSLHQGTERDHDRSGKSRLNTSDISGPATTLKLVSYVWPCSTTCRRTGWMAAEVQPRRPGKTSSKHKPQESAHVSLAARPHQVRRGTAGPGRGAGDAGERDAECASAQGRRVHGRVCVSKAIAPSRHQSCRGHGPVDWPPPADGSSKIPKPRTRKRRAVDKGLRQGWEQLITRSPGAVTNWVPVPQFRLSFRRRGCHGKGIGSVGEPVSPYPETEFAEACKVQVHRADARSSIKLIRSSPSKLTGAMLDHWSIRLALASWDR